MVAHQMYLRVTSEVPQGSVLEPILFLSYVYNLASVIPDGVTIRSFVDDCILYKEIWSLEDHKDVQDSILAISAWCNL